MISLHSHNDNSGDIEVEASLTLHYLLEYLYEAPHFWNDRISDHSRIQRVDTIDIRDYLLEPLAEWFCDPQHDYITKHFNTKLRYAINEYNHKISMFRRKDQRHALNLVAKETLIRFNMSREHALDFKLRFGGTF